MFRNKILGEMKLLIKESKENFISYSNSFHGYIRGLVSAKFGAISQLSAIWVTKDPRSKTYIDYLERTNKRKVITN